jgi:hypothetical protein
MPLTLTDFGLTGFIDFSDATKGTVDASNRISAWQDSLGLLANFTQGTDANKPLLTRSDNKENRLVESENLSSSWLYGRAVNISTTEFKEDATAANTHYVIQTIPALTPSSQYYVQASVKRGTGNRDFYFSFRKTSGGGTSAFFMNLTTGAITSPSGWTVNPVSMVDPQDPSYWMFYGIKTGDATADTYRFECYLTDAGVTSYNGDNTSSIFVTRTCVRAIQSDSTYLATTTAPQYRGVNGRRALRFNGGQRLASTSLLSNIITNTASLYYIVLKPSLVTSTQVLFEDNGSYSVNYIDSGATLRFQNDDGAADNIRTSAVSTNTAYILRTRHDAGNIYISIDTGSGFSAETGLATAVSGNTTLLTGVLGIGQRNGGTLGFYGDIAFIGTANTGATKPNLERLLREEFFGKSSLRINLLTGGLRVGNTTSYI